MALRELAYTNTYSNNYNKLSKNFDERPHRKSDIYGGKVNVTPASREQCRCHTDAVIDFLLRTPQQ